MRSVLETLVTLLAFGIFGGVMGIVMGGIGEKIQNRLKAPPKDPDDDRR